MMHAVLMLGLVMTGSVAPGEFVPHAHALVCEILTFVNRGSAELGENSARLRDVSSATALHAMGTSSQRGPTLRKLLGLNSATFRTESSSGHAQPPEPWP